MSMRAPLRITLEIRLQSGESAGERRYRLTSSIELPPGLAMAGSLPVEGRGEGRVTFVLPDGPRIEALARLSHDPEHPEEGSYAELLDLRPEAVQAIRRYIEERLSP